MHPARLRLGQLLVDARILTVEQLEDVLALQKTDGRKLGALLVESGLVTETLLTQVLSQQLSVPWVSLNHIDFSRELLNLIPLDVAEKYCLVPIYVRAVRGQGDTLYVAMEDPMSEEGLRDCEGREDCEMGEADAERPKRRGSGLSVAAGQVKSPGNRMTASGLEA